MRFSLVGNNSFYIKFFAFILIALALKMISMPAFVLILMAATVYVIGSFTYPELRGGNLMQKVVSVLTGVVLPTFFFSTSTFMWSMAFNGIVINGTPVSVNYPALVLPTFLVTMAVSGFFGYYMNTATENANFRYQRHFVAVSLCGLIFLFSAISILGLVLL